jgi:long-chain acyl-CoA synthetase
VSWHIETEPEIREEVHFTDRHIRCFSKRPQNVDQMLREAVARNAAGDAIIDGDAAVSYGDLDAIVSRIASHLLALGIARGDRVALVLSNSAEFIYVLMATARIAAIGVPVNVREQTPEFAYILNHSGAKVLVHDATVFERLPPPQDVPHLVHRYSLGGAVAGSRRFEELVVEPASSSTARAPDEEDVAVILYTSGTTGRPKGAMLTHFNICHSVMHFEMCMVLTQAERSVLAVPASHVTGLVANILTMIKVAGCSLILPQFDARTVLDLGARERMTHTLMVPAMYNLCLLRADFDGFDLSHWRIGSYGGAPMPEATIATLAQKLPHLVLMNAYGATEVTSPATIMPMGDTARRPDSVGRAVPCAEIAIMDEDGCEVARGDVGEIWIAGPMTVPGYWNDEERTATSFVDGFWKSGDIGSMDDDGFVRLHDRKKDMIIRGGYNVYSAELENTLSYHPGVIECAAVARPDPVLGEKIHVFVRAGAAVPTADELRSFCAEQLADYKVPDFVTFLDAPLPRNANGKILKNALRKSGEYA